MRDERRKGIWRKRTILFLGGIIIALLLVRGVMDWTSAGALTDTLADFEQRWGPLDPAAVGPPEIPASQNRARCYSAAASLIDFDGKIDNETLRGRGNSLGVSQAVVRNPEAVRALLEKNRLALGLMAESVHRPSSDWEIPYEKGVEASAPRLLDLMHLSRMVAARAALALVDEDLPAALSGIRQGFQLSSSMRQEPMLMAQLVGISMEAELMGVLRSVLSSGRLSAEDLQELKLSLSELSGPKEFHDALKNETTAMHMALADITAGARSEVMDNQPVFTEGAVQWAIRPAVRKAHNLYLSEMDKVIDRQGTPRFQRPTMEENRDMPWYGKLFATVPNMEKMLLRADLAGARKALAWTSVALLSHYLESGALPADLGELVPATMDQVLADPFTGKPLEYVPSETGFVLKSAGEGSLDKAELPGDPVTTWEVTVPSR